MHEQFGAALAFFEKAKPLAAPLNMQVVGKPPSTGVERLIEAAKTGKTLTPDIARKGDSTAKLAMMLADIYHEARQYDKSLDRCNRLLTIRGDQCATPEQRAYAYYKRARNRYLMMGQKFDPNATIADYLAAVSAAPRWSGPTSRSFLPRTSIGTMSRTPTRPFWFGNASSGNIPRAMKRRVARFTSGSRATGKSSIQRPTRCWRSFGPLPGFQPCSLGKAASCPVRGRHESGGEAEIDRTRHAPREGNRSHEES